MSIFAFLERRKSQTRMPRTEVDELGIRNRGPVLSGRLSHEMAQLLARQWKPGERYRKVEDYDPVLRSHRGEEPAATP